MEDIVDFVHLRGQLQFVRHCATTIKNLEWANIPGFKLALDMKMLHALEWCDSEKD
jgi:hypothetical protein